MLPSPSLGAATGDAKVADSSMETPWVDSKDRSCHNPSAQQAEKSSLSERSRSERSMAFKRWARGRCYRCLALDHQVSSCRDSFRCIRCRRPGHRERHCHFDPRLQHHEPAHHSPNLNVLSKQGVGLMLWPRLHSVHLTFSWQLRLAPSFSVMQEDLCVDVSAMPLLGWLPRTFSLCLPR